MAQHSGKFKLVIMKVESEVMSDTSWEVYVDLDVMGADEEDSSLLPFRVRRALDKARSDCAGWNAENARILAGGSNGRSG